MEPRRLALRSAYLLGSGPALTGVADGNAVGYPLPLAPRNLAGSRLGPALAETSWRLPARLILAATCEVDSSFPPAKGVNPFTPV